LLELVADVAEDVRDQRAQEEKSHDHDDRNEGEKQTVLNESLAFLVRALNASEKSADDVTNHEVLEPPFREDLQPESMGLSFELKWPNGPTRARRRPYLALRPRTLSIGACPPDGEPIP